MPDDLVQFEGVLLVESLNTILTHKELSAPDGLVTCLKREEAYLFPFCTGTQS